MAEILDRLIIGALASGVAAAVMLPVFWWLLKREMRQIADEHARSVARSTRDAAQACVRAQHRR